VEIRKKTCLKTKKKTMTTPKRVTFSEPISFEVAAAVLDEDENEGSVEAIGHGRFTRSISFRVQVSSEFFLVASFTV
jgi:hypothetical protein